MRWEGVKRWGTVLILYIIQVLRFTFHLQLTFNPFPTPFRYDPQTNTWRFVQSMHVCRGGVGVAALGGYLFAVGGHDGKAYLNTVEMYCPNSDTWTMAAPMKTSRAGAGVVACPLATFNGSYCISESLGSL